jgi:hypothetical protein
MLMIPCVLIILASVGIGAIVGYYSFCWVVARPIQPSETRQTSPTQSHDG